MPELAAIYCRVSTKEQADSGTSLDTQLAAGRAFAERNGWEVSEAHVVREDHTGTDLGRPGITSLLEGAAARSFTQLVIYTLDRLHRP